MDPSSYSLHIRKVIRIAHGWGEEWDCHCAFYCLWGVLNARLSPAAPHNLMKPHEWGSQAVQVSWSTNNEQFHSSELSLEGHWWTLMTESLWNPAGLHAADHKLWAQCFSQFSVYLTVHLSILYFTSLSVRILWEALLNTLLNRSNNHCSPFTTKPVTSR